MIYRSCNILYKNTTRIEEGRSCFETNLNFMPIQSMYAAARLATFYLFPGTSWWKCKFAWKTFAPIQRAIEQTLLNGHMHLFVSISFNDVLSKEIKFWKNKMKHFLPLSLILWMTSRTTTSSRMFSVIFEASRNKTTKDFFFSTDKLYDGRDRVIKKISLWKFVKIKLNRWMTK